MRQHHAGLAHQKSTCTLSWVDGRGRGVGLRGGNGVDPDKHASFSALTVVFMDGSAFHCCLSFSPLALVSASDTISSRDAISRAGCGFPALAPVSLLTAVFEIDCCFSYRLPVFTSTAVSHVDRCFSRRPLFLTSTVVSHVDCCFPGSVSFSGSTAVLGVNLHSRGPMSRSSNHCCFHARCHFPCRVLFSTSTAGSSVDR